MKHWRRIEDPKVGARAWLLSANFGRWLWRKEVKVIGLFRDGVTADVEAGTWSRQVFIHHLDCGREFRTAGGEWIPETDDRVRRWLIKAIKDIDAGGSRVIEPKDELNREYIRDDLYWVLRRNGWKL
ncbi:hypothetical protein OKA04_04610 [Luteolibacter flavescens]|uniref:Uncharacterized protein n=1 Tax=Luteolibacter flavescens TaxID=1859460 RepID=A0ABT3FK95_9BACT|nr:hypothetical protein [Luteolibacter flavescens]MCW1883998.1 hypothetical protein [Luteolibacter flavescens]